MSASAKPAKKTAAARNTSEWHVTCSAMSARIENPIRSISDKASSIVAAGGGHTKPVIKLSIGDPTLDKNFFGAPQSHIDAVKAAVDSHEHNGYAHASGMPEARQAVSQFWAKNFITAPEDPNDADEKAAYERKVASIPWQHVVLTSGGSHAIQLAITSICGPGDNVLLPMPCFPHYITICDTFKIKKKFYKLNPNHHWEANLKHIEAKCDANTKMMVVTNPSNPCGSNYSRSHVEDIIKLAEKLKLPIFADEIYAGMVFQNEQEHPNAVGAKQRNVFTSVVDFNTSVPRVVLGGTAKQFAVPGWRLGWLMYAADSSLPQDADKDKKKSANLSGGNLLYGIEQQALLIVGPTTLAQAALPPFLANYSTSMSPQGNKTPEERERETPEEKDKAFFYRYVTQIEQCARTFVTALNEKCRVPSSEGAATAKAAKGTNGSKKAKKAAPHHHHHHMVYAQMPQGSMYVMMKVNTQYFDPKVVKDDLTFFENILKEQQVQFVPGSAFRRPGYLRVVVTRPEPVLLEAVDRIAAFCHAHYDADNATKHAEAKAGKRKKALSAEKNKKKAMKKKKATTKNKAAATAEAENGEADAAPAPPVKEEVEQEKPEEEESDERNEETAEAAEEQAVEAASVEPAAVTTSAEDEPTKEEPAAADSSVHSASNGQMEKEEGN